MNNKIYSYKEKKLLVYACNKEFILESLNIEITDSLQGIANI